MCNPNLIPLRRTQCTLSTGWWCASLLSNQSPLYAELIPSYPLSASVPFVKHSQLEASSRNDCGGSTRVEKTGTFWQSQSAALREVRWCNQVTTLQHNDFTLKVTQTLINSERYCCVGAFHSWSVCDRVCECVMNMPSTACNLYHSLYYHIWQQANKCVSFI